MQRGDGQDARREDGAPRPQGVEGPPAAADLVDKVVEPLGVEVKEPLCVRQGDVPRGDKVPYGPAPGVETLGVLARVMRVEGRTAGLGVEWRDGGWEEARMMRCDVGHAFVQYVHHGGRVVVPRGHAAAVLVLLLPARVHRVWAWPVRGAAQPGERRKGRPLSQLLDSGVYQFEVPDYILVPPTAIVRHPSDGQRDWRARRPILVGTMRGGGGQHITMEEDRLTETFRP